MNIAYFVDKKFKSCVKSHVWDSTMSVLAVLWMRVRLYDLQCCYFRTQWVLTKLFTLMLCFRSVRIETLCVALFVLM